MAIKVSNGNLQVGVSIATALIVLSGVAWAGWYWRDISARFETVQTSVMRNSEAIKTNDGRIDALRSTALTKEDFDRMVRALGTISGPG